MMLQTLGKVLEQVRSGFACGEEDPCGIFQFRMNNVTREGAIDLAKIRRVPVLGRKLEPYLLRTGDVLFNATNSAELVGKTAYVGSLAEQAVFSNHFLRLRTDASRLDGQYLARWLQKMFSERVFEGMCRQWVGQATVSRERLLEMSIPVPALTEQRRIAAILDQAEALRAQRRVAIALLDDLGKSIFFEMFGDPCFNPRGWHRVRIGELGQVITGNTPSRSQPANFGSAIEWIKSDNINGSGYFLSRAEEGLSERGRAIGRVAPVGSILVTCIAGSPSCIGNSSMADREVAFNQQINAFVPVATNLHFAYMHLALGKALVQQASTSGMKGMVSKSKFANIALMQPPVALQEQFADRAQVLRNLLSTHLTALAHLDALFASLQHRAFRGEL